jgi:hypothetical protein
VKKYICLAFLFVQNVVAMEQQCSLNPAMLQELSSQQNIQKALTSVHLDGIEINVPERSELERLRDHVLLLENERAEQGRLCGPRTITTIVAAVMGVAVGMGISAVVATVVILTH